MKEEILRLMKEQLHAVTEKITYDNYREMEGQIFRVFTILESAETMINSPIHPLVVPIKEEKQELPPLISKILEECSEPEMTMEELLAEEQKEKELDERRAYRFERKIKGGVVPEIDAFVPEKAIYELDLCHGDKVYVHFLFKPENGPTRYEYELAEKADPPCSPENLVDIRMGVVSYEPRFGGLAIMKTVGSEDLRYEGEKLALKISDEDMNAMDLKEGDIVNAAFYANNPEYMRVRWKYSMNEYETEQSIERRATSYSKKKDDSSKNKVDKIFKDKKICVMGYEPGWAAFREEVEKRGGELVTLTGRESFDSVYGTIKKSDCLLLMIGHVGHTGTIFAVDFCKKNHIPQTSLRTFGRTAFVDAATTMIKK